MCMMDSLKVDTSTTDAFAGRMIDILNGAGLAMMISVGHRTGLFDAMANREASTSEQIAEAAGLHERYVREWLGAMTTGRIVEHDHTNGTYRLPEAHAALLTRKAAPDNLAAMAQYIAVLGSVENRIVDCFRHGGGVPYAEYPRFQKVMAEDSAQTVVAALAAAILPLVPGLIEKLEAGIDVLDVGCGCGRAINTMAQTFPDSRFTGYDISEEGVQAGRAEAERLGLTNASFEVRDVTLIGGEASYDLITAFDAIHDQAKPAKVLAGIAGALREGGAFLMQDIRGSSHLHKNLDHPIAPLLYTISCMHCMTVSLASGGDGLGTMWGQELAETMLGEAGFADVAINELPHDIQNVYYVATR